jgi:hypothetical protein
MEDRRGSYRVCLGDVIERGHVEDEGIDGRMVDGRLGSW